MRSVVCVALPLVLAACAPSAIDDRGGGDDDDTADASVGIPDAKLPVWIDSAIFPDSSTIVADAKTCGAQTTPIVVTEQRDPPDLLIVLDRSGSMNSDLPFSFPPLKKWDVMRDALNTMGTSMQDKIRLGLEEFPTDDSCAVADPGAVKVPIDLGQAPEIAAYFTSRGPGGQTPAAFGLATALHYYQGKPVNPAGRYVLFATDGNPNCAGSSDSETVQAVKNLKNAGIKSYVLGFGGGILPGFGTILDQAALEGGVPKPGGPPHYYAANTPAELATALDQIAGGITPPTCVYKLASAPPVPDDVTVTLDGATVPRSTQHTDGWDYHPDAMTITFFGSYCTKITSGAVTSVSFVYGCPGPVLD